MLVLRNKNGTYGHVEAVYSLELRKMGVAYVSMANTTASGHVYDVITSLNVEKQSKGARTLLIEETITRDVQTQNKISCIVMHQKWKREEKARL